MNRSTLPICALWLALAANAQAETAADAAVSELERIQVVATRSERAIAEVPNTVDVIDRERMDERLVRDLKDLFRYEPGITVGNSLGRFGIGDIRIHGLAGATNTLVLGEDKQTRARISFAHEMDALQAGFADSLDWQVYRQDSQTTQYTLEERTLPPPTLRDRRERSFNFDQCLYGAQANFRKSFALGGSKHELAYGFDLSRTQTRQKRDGLRTFLATGTTTPALLPDVFPVWDFPISQSTVAALYAQDEISFREDDFRLTPALRLDHYTLKSEIDTIFAQDNPGVAVARVSESNLLPKLGAVWHFTEDWSLLGGYSRGFRSPPYSDVNIGFTNLQFGYTAIANPDLKPETSDGLEAGLRFAGDAVYASLAMEW